MLYEISKELGAALALKGVPVHVVYGPEATSTTSVGARERIVLEHDRQTGDTFRPPRARGMNPRMRAVRATGAVLRIYAQATVTGAAVHDHERRAEAVLDRAYVALEGIVGARRTLWNVTSARFLTSDDLKAQGLAVWSGAVYELRFTVDRAVNDATWAGAGIPTATLGEGGAGGIKSKTRVSMAHGAGTDVDTDGDGVPDNAETSCGG